VLLELMCLEIHLGRKDDEFLLQALSIHTHEMILLKMVLERIVVDVIMRIPAIRSVAEEASLMLLPTMHIKLVIPVEPLPTEAAQWMALETTLVDCSWIIISLRHMLLQLLIRKQVMLVREYLLISRAEITHLLVVDSAHMTMQVRPSSNGDIAVWIRAVVVQEIG